MNSATLIANRFKEVVLHGKWIANTNFKDQLDHINWEQATHKVGTLNTIAALTFHINYYIAGILNFFEKGTLEIRDKYSFDLPPIHSKEDWQRLRNELWDNTEQLARYIAQLSEEKLDDHFVHEKYGSYRRNMEGVIEHCYYHLGQVSLIKKMILTTETIKRE